MRPDVELLQVRGIINSVLYITVKSDPFYVASVFVLPSGVNQRWNGFLFRVLVPLEVPSSCSEGVFRATVALGMLTGALGTICPGQQQCIFH